MCKRGLPDREPVYNRRMHLRVMMTLALWSVANGLGCGESAADQRAVELRARSAALAADPELADTLGQALLAQIETQAAGWIKQDKLHRGKLAERARQDFLTVLTDGHCYRFISVAGTDVLDLDLALFDANNVEVQRDVTEDPTPRLGSEAAICPIEPMAFRLEVRMRRGHGPFAIATLRN